ncbi:restriction endonuclease [Pelomonas margarita]|uniref:Restriction endonuclease n=1 Tax=Pelomonas margarita TaxID=3299031 RepID=A0ABW7FC39_9BURK
MLPLLKSAQDGGEHTMRQTVERLAVDFNLSQEEQTELLPSGQQAVFTNRVAWARFYLKKAGLIDSPRRGSLKITERGLSVLANSPTTIDNKFLDQYQEFKEFRESSKSPQMVQSPTSTEEELQTPEENLEQAHQRIRSELAEELLQKILVCSPAFFEHLVVELLVKMGYGGSRKDAGERVGQSGDGGIDGIIKEDRLGLDTIYIQAKRWQGTVGRPEIQKFVGALSGQRAKKGVFIATSRFTADAIEYVSLIETKVVLIDGGKLAALMIDFDVGVSTQATYVIKKIDSDYFEEA